MFAITLDIDWAPDFIIQSVSDFLLQHEVKSTWFVTHKSKEVEALSGHRDLIERGIHPNFLKNSTQGSTYREVLQAVKDIVPEAKCARTHSLYQSNPLLRTMCVEYGIEFDSSLFLRDYQNVQPLEFEFSNEKKTLTRIPYIWGDQYEITRSVKNLQFKNRFEFSGIKVFNFHPVHVYFNAFNDSAYQQLKLLSPDITKANQKKAEALINTTQRGVKDFLLDLVTKIKENGRGVTLSEITNHHLARS